MNQWLKLIITKVRDLRSSVISRPYHSPKEIAAEHENENKWWKKE
jgi:hypothetical protein